MHDTPDDPTAQNVRAIADLERKALDQRSRADRLADAIERATGTLVFATTNVALFAAWILLNTGVIPGIRPFDPYPFSFLTFLVSLEAIVLSIFVLMSQNRMMRQADKRAHLDLQVNILAEQELTAVLDLHVALCRHLGLSPDSVNDRVRHLLENTDVRQLAKKVDRDIPSE